MIRAHRVVEPLWFHYASVMSSTVTLKNVPDDLVAELKTLANTEDRSLNQQAIHLLRRAISDVRTRRGQTEADWQVDRWEKLAESFKQAGFPSTKEVIKSRRSSKRVRKTW